MKVVYKDTVPFTFEKQGNIANSDYSLNYKSNQKGISITDLVIENDITIVTGLKRKWFLGKETNTIDVSHSNELVKVKEIKYIENKPKKKWYDTNAFKIGIGFVAGAMLVQ